MESNIRTVGLLITLFFAFYAFNKRKDMPAIVFVALSPLTYFAQSVGFVLTPAKLLGLIFLGFLFLKPGLIKIRKNKYFSNFKYYYIYTIYLTIVMSLFWPEFSASSQNFLYGNTMRGIVQIFQTFMGLAIIIVLMNSLTTIHSLFRVQVVMLLSMVSVSIYGLYVWFAQRTGLPFNPITRQGGKAPENYRTVQAMIDGVRVVRAYSITGEPKALAVNACFGVILTYFTRAHQIRFLKGIKGEVFLMVLFLVTLYLTFSTAGYIILPMVIFVAIVAQFMVGQLNGDMIRRVLVFFVLMVIVAFLADIDILGKIVSMFENRVESRLNESGMFTFAEAAMVSFWGDNPLYTVSGVGLGGSSFYVREYNTSSYAGYTAAPRGIVGFIGDKGIIGLFLFLVAIYKPTIPLIAAARSNSPNRKIFAGILIICLVNVVLLFTYALWSVEWLTVALLCSGATLAERETHMRKTVAFQQAVRVRA